MKDTTLKLAPRQVITYQTRLSYGFLYVTHVDQATAAVTGIDLTVEKESFGTEISLEGEVLEVNQREVPEETIDDLVEKAERAKTLKAAKILVMDFVRGRKHNSTLREAPPVDLLASKESIDPRSSYLFMRVLGHPPPKKRRRLDL